MRLLLLTNAGAAATRLADFLGESGFPADVERAGELAAARAESTNYGLIVIHAVIAEEGFTALRHIRGCSRVPVLLVIPTESWEDRVRGFTLGADDCLSDPWRPEELLARIRAILRRAVPETAAPEVLRVGQLRFSPGSREAYCGDRPLKLTAMECAILELLMREAGRVVTRDQISMLLYGRVASPFDRSVDTHVSRIRRKLGTAGSMIVSARATGYQLCCPPPEDWGRAARSAPDNWFPAQAGIRH